MAGVMDRGFGVLFRVFLLGVLDLEVLSRDGDTTKLLGQLVTILAGLSLLFSLPLLVMARVSFECVKGARTAVFNALATEALYALLWSAAGAIALSVVAYPRFLLRSLEAPEPALAFRSWRWRQDLERRCLMR